MFELLIFGDSGTRPALELPCECPCTPEQISCFWMSSDVLAPQYFSSQDRTLPPVWPNWMAGTHDSKRHRSSPISQRRNPANHSYIMWRGGKKSHAEKHKYTPQTPSHAQQHRVNKHSSGAEHTKTNPLTKSCTAAERKKDIYTVVFTSFLVEWMTNSEKEAPPIHLAGKDKGWGTSRDIRLNWFARTSFIGPTKFLSALFHRGRCCQGWTMTLKVRAQTFHRVLVMVTLTTLELFMEIHPQTFAVSCTQLKSFIVFLWTYNTLKLFACFH